MFSRCILRAYINFNVNLFFLLFSILFRKQLITLGLTTTFVYFQETFCSLKVVIQSGEYINVTGIFLQHFVKFAFSNFYNILRFRVYIIYLQLSVNFIVLEIL